MNKYLHIRIDEKLKEQAEAVAESKGLKLSDYVRNLLTTTIKKENIKMIINLNVNNSVEVYEVNKATKYDDIANIIHHKLDDAKIAIRNTEDCNIETLNQYLDVNWFEFEDDVLYIR